MLYLGKLLRDLFGYASSQVVNLSVNAVPNQWTSKGTTWNNSGNWSVTDSGSLKVKGIPEEILRLVIKKVSYYRGKRLLSNSQGAKVRKSRSGKTRSSSEEVERRPVILSGHSCATDEVSGKDDLKTPSPWDEEARDLFVMQHFNVNVEDIRLSQQKLGESHVTGKKKDFVMFHRPT